MGVIDWIKGFFGDSNTVKLTDHYIGLAVEHHFKRLAIETCIDLIANALVLCEFQTFKEGKEFRGENYYLLNVSPNQNQNASEFLKSLVSHLIKNNEALVIMQNNKLYVAESFSRTEYALFDNYYEGITVNGYSFNKRFYEQDVLYFRLNDENIKSVIDSLYESYGKLISSAMNIYKRSNAKRFVLKGDFLRPQTDEEQEMINDMFDNQFKAWLEADKAGAVFQLQKGYDLEDMSGSGKSGSPTTTSRDIRALVDDIFDFVAMGFHIPRGILKGDLADLDKQIDILLMLGLNPLAELITDEFNRKMYTKEEFLKRTYTKLDTTRIKILDVVQLATSADKFFAIGVNSINDNLRMLGREPINEEWADRRFVTKNYSLVENIEETEGGEKNGNSIA